MDSSGTTASWGGGVTAEQMAEMQWVKPALAAAADSQRIGWDRIRLVPTLFWLGTSDGFLRALCVSGTVLAGLLIAGAMPALLLPLLWAGYLSLAVV